MKANQFALALAVSIGGGLWASLPLSALAAGNVDTTSGETSVLSPGGKPRALAKGDRIVEGDTIVTGNSGAVLITTDDSGVLAVRPRTRLTIDAYKVNGNEQDSVVLNLLRGSLRSITGWISKTSPKNYKVNTSTATIGIRGTDHEVSIGEGDEAAPGASKDGQADDTGTWNQVTEGATTLATGTGNSQPGSAAVLLEQKAGTPSAIGRVKAPGQAPVQAVAPATLFKPQATDARNAELKKDAQANQQLRLETRKAQVAAAGGASAQGATKVSTQCAPNAPAQKALDDLIRAYEQGDIAFLQQRLSPSMVGYSALINDVQTSTTTQRQTRIQIKNRQMQCGPDVSSITFSWEKTFLDAVSFQPGIVRGTGSVLLTGLGGGQWQVGGMAGNMPFVSSGLATADGTVSVSVPGVVFGNNPSGCNPANETVIVSSVQVGLGPSYSIAQYFTPSTVCSIALQTPGGNACQLRVTSLSGSLLANLSGTLSPDNPSLTNCSRSYAGTSGSIPANVSVISTALTLAVLANNTTASGPAGSTIQLNAPTIFSGNRPTGLGGGYTANDTLQTNNRNCAVMAYTLPAASPGGPQVCSAVPSSLNAAIEVRDADVTTPTLEVQVGASNGDAEVFVLPRVSAGVYRLNTLPIARGSTSAINNNGRIDLPASNANNIITLSINYNDARATTGVNVVRQTTLQLIP